MLIGFRASAGVWEHVWIPKKGDRVVAGEELGVDVVRELGRKVEERGALGGQGCVLLLLLLLV